MPRPDAGAGGALEPELRAGLAALSLPVDDTQVKLLLQYLQLLHKWNRVYNLTAVREQADMLAQHLLDSLALVTPLQRHAAGRPLRILDVGSGGGLPGVALAIALPDFDVLCVDAVAKKSAFITQVAGELALPQLRARHARVETLQEPPFDVITARAFASLADLIRLTRPLLAKAGVWVAMKGRRPDDEIAALPADVEVFHVEQLQVPGLDAQRCLVWMRLR